VKKIDPTKNVASVVVIPTASSNAGIGPTRKHVEPIENSSPIHHVSPREDASALRCRRADQSTTSPSAVR
jgi:hypothetical protein